MAAQKASIKLPKQSLVKMGICALIIVAFVGLLILPNILEDRDVKHEILTLQAEIERQKILFPIYIKLQSELTRKVVDELPIPEPTALTEAEIDKATHDIEDVAIRTKLKINDVTPDPASLTKAAGYVGVNCDFYGSYFNLRAFLIELGSLPYLKHIEKLDMQEGADGVNFTMRLHLAVKTG